MKAPAEKGTVISKLIHPRTLGTQRSKAPLPLPEERQEAEHFESRITLGDVLVNLQDLQPICPLISQKAGGAGRRSPSALESK